MKPFIMEQVNSVQELMELTWDVWAKCFWWTLVLIITAKVIIYTNSYYGRIGFWKWMKGKPMLDLVSGFGITSVAVLLGVDTVSVAEWFGWDLGKIGEVLKSAANNPIKFTVLVTILVQAIIYWRRNKKTDGNVIYGITPPPGTPPHDNPPDGDEED